MKTAMQELIDDIQQAFQGQWGVYLNSEKFAPYLEKEKEQNNQIVRDVFEHCWNHPNWEGEYDIKDMNDYLERLNK